MCDYWTINVRKINIGNTTLGTRNRIKTNKVKDTIQQTKKLISSELTKTHINPRVREVCTARLFLIVKSDKILILEERTDVWEIDYWKDEVTTCVVTFLFFG